MGLIQSQTFGLMKPSPRITARNAHLIPEIYTRAKRILHSAAEEMIAANSVVRTMAELWTQMVSGTPCTCKQDNHTELEERQARNGVPDLANFLLSGNLRILNEEEFCPICYGTGIEGGYNLWGTVSVTLTAHSPDLKLTGDLARKEGAPYTILCGGKGKATWTVEFPHYWLQAHTIALYWKKKPESYQLYINDEEFNLDIFNTLGQIPQDGKIKIELEIEDTSGTSELYYLRFFLKISRDTLVSVDLPNYTYNYTGELSVAGERQSTVTANFDSRPGKIEVTDLFVVEQDGIIWKVIENEFINPMGVEIASQCQARLVRSFERAYMLPSKPALKTYPMDNIEFIY